MKRAMVLLLLAVFSGCAGNRGVVVKDPRFGTEQVVYEVTEPGFRVSILYLDDAEAVGHHSIRVTNLTESAYEVTGVQLIGAGEAEPIEVWISPPSGAFEFENLACPGESIEFITGYVPAGRGPEAKEGVVRIVLEEVTRTEGTTYIDVPVAFSKRG
ncbi:MAG: hypothetical protein HY720_02715 [Planctomycetes bacterium]|nr:hypothetical protein [Planctomycetota bacterium]